MEKKIENSHLVAADATETRDIFDSITIHSQLLEKYIRLSQTHALDFNGQGTPATTAPTNNITELPHEIIQTIVLECDLMTLLMVRCSGPQLTKLVDSIPEFKKLIQCPTTARPINLAIATGNASRITLTQLFKIVYQQTCHGCGKYAPFIDANSLSRRCLSCSTQAAPFACIATSFLDSRSYDVDDSIMCFHTKCSGDVRGQARILDSLRLRQYLHQPQLEPKIYNESDFRKHVDKVHSGEGADLPEDYVSDC